MKVCELLHLRFHFCFAEAGGALLFLGNFGEEEPLWETAPSCEKERGVVDVSCYVAVTWSERGDFVGDAEDAVVF